jgi:hypothetical protein
MAIVIIGIDEIEMAVKAGLFQNFSKNEDSLLLCAL